MRRHATLADVEAIVAMGERFRASTAYASIIAQNLDQAHIFMTRMVSGADSVVLVADRAGTLVGMIAVLLYTHYFSGRGRAVELVWWVDQNERGSLGVRLLKDAERWARQHGAEALEVSAPTPRVEQLYDRLGYRPVERMYHRSL